MYIKSVLVSTIDVIIVIVYCELAVCRYGLSVTIETTCNDDRPFRAVWQHVVLLTKLLL